MRRRLLWLLVLVPLLFPMAAFALARLQATPTSLAFGEHCVRVDRTQRSITLENVQSPNATDVRVSLSPSSAQQAFSLSGATAVPTLEPGKTATFQVGFQAQRAGSTEAAAVVSYITQDEP